MTKRTIPDLGELPIYFLCKALFKAPIKSRMSVNPPAILSGMPAARYLRLCRNVTLLKCPVNVVKPHAVPQIRVLNANGYQSASVLHPT